MRPMRSANSRPGSGDAPCESVLRLSPVRCQAKGCHLWRDLWMHLWRPLSVLMPLLHVNRHHATPICAVLTNGGFANSALQRKGTQCACEAHAGTVVCSCIRIPRLSTSRRTDSFVLGIPTKRSGVHETRVTPAGDRDARRDPLITERGPCPEDARRSGPTNAANHLDRPSPLPLCGRAYFGCASSSASRSTASQRADRSSSRSEASFFSPDAPNATPSAIPIASPAPGLSMAAPTASPTPIPMARPAPILVDRALPFLFLSF